MSKELVPGFRYLDHCIENTADLQRVSQALEKISKCCLAVEKRINLADIMHDAENKASMLKAFGAANYPFGVQLLLKLALAGHKRRSFSLTADVNEKKQRDFLFKCVGSWRQFDSVIAFSPADTCLETSVILINPTKSHHWTELPPLSAKTVVTVYLRGTEKNKAVQEDLALERYEAAFDLVQNQGAWQEEGPKPAVELTGSRPPVVRNRASTRQRCSAAELSVLSFTLKLIVSKTDVFVHAGNAQLIVTHIRNYPGRVAMYVQRETKKQIQLDVDSIWSAEVRNGETVLFDFFGPKPGEDFVKELAKKVNKYTQMDKMANE